MSDLERSTDIDSPIIAPDHARAMRVATAVQENFYLPESRLAAARNFSRDYDDIRELLPQKLRQLGLTVIADALEAA